MKRKKKKPMPREEKAKLIYQKAKRLNKVHILKFACYKLQQALEANPTYPTVRTWVDITAVGFSRLSLEYELDRWEKEYKKLTQ